MALSNEMYHEFDFCFFQHSYDFDYPGEKERYDPNVRGENSLHTAELLKAMTQLFNLKIVKRLPLRRKWFGDSGNGFGRAYCVQR